MPRSAQGVVLGAGLLANLGFWRLRGKSLSVSHIQTTRAELFCWVAILLSNTLGTALGDLLAEDAGLGLVGGAALIGSAIAVVALASRLTRLNRVLLFWAAFVLTRPFGATFGDLLTKPVDRGGLGFGTVRSSAVLGILLVALVTHSIISDRRAAARGQLSVQ